jgi:hypothetical protein
MMKVLASFSWTSVRSSLRKWATIWGK